ncbi:MAG TPA: hypothetical protein PL068_11095 [Petrotogaceae bacterium]|nr:hypothetical protein [Petrotogaceae bacterium]
MKKFCFWILCFFVLFGLYGCIIRGNANPAPQAISPYNGEAKYMDPDLYKENDLYTLNFNWTFPTTISTNLQYEFYYSDSSSNLVIPVKTVNSRSTSYQINLSEGKTYYWKVVALDRNTGKEYLPTAYSWKFTIGFKK